ncbi:unnamed protein product [Brassicogethes aeneus]|uniref:Thioredoxin domain-containing protein n=1 Tax=Brassicogethes aeneus TaxID=1431903 RepID=A0A9P0B998_BRAAE|nr:unnamed protein product [Brassicogethes aeneus]
MAKKGAAVQLQQEVGTEEEWERLLEREGLIVCDIYSDWCGPCSAMSAVLKKIKLEIGGDMLHLAMAKSDEIEPLKRFRTKSEPTWMFLSNGKITNLMFGADSPRLQRLILAELKKEEAFRQGLSDREGVDVTERFGVEIERWEEDQGKELAMQEREEAKKLKEEMERKKKESQNILEMMDAVGCVLIFPHAKGKYQEVLGDLINEAGLMIKEREKVTITDQILQELYYFCDGVPFPEITVEEMKEEECIVLLLKPQASKELDIPKIDKPLLQIVYGPMEKAPGSPGSPAQKLYKLENPLPSAEVEITAPSVMEVVADVPPPPPPAKKEEDEDEEEEGSEEREEGSEEDEGIGQEKEEEPEEEPEKEEEVPEEAPPPPPPPEALEIGENDLMGVWVPPTDKVRSTCLKVLNCYTDLLLNYCLLKIYRFSSRNIAKIV